jgi:hypothetical protein
MDSLILAQPGQTSIASRMLDPRAALLVGVVRAIVLFMSSFAINQATRIRTLQDDDVLFVDISVPASERSFSSPTSPLTSMLMTFQFFQGNRILLLNFLDDRQRRLIGVKWFHHEIGDVNEFDCRLPIDDVPL